MIGMMSTLTILAVLAAAAPANPTPADATPEDRRIEIEVGEQQVMAFPGTSRVSIGDPAIGDVHVSDSGEILLLGKAEGRTTLIVWQGKAHTSYDVSVTLGRAKQMEQAVHALWGCDKLDVKEINGKILIQGTLADLEAYRHLQVLAASEPDMLLMVELPRVARGKVVDEINAAFFKEGLTAAHAEQVGNQIFLEGQVEDEADLKRAQLIAQSLYGEALSTLP